MSRTSASVRALVVTTGRSGFLAQTLIALANQSHRPDSTHVVVVGKVSDADLGIPAGVEVQISRVKARTFGQAVSGALVDIPASDDEWLWTLHDDSAPEPEALHHLLVAARKRRLAEVIGAAQVQWDEPSRLVNVGITVPRLGARRINVVEQDDLDQGQHDAREDVLAVGLAGALVRRALWERLDGTDPAYGHWGDSTDFCRRAWRAGADVVVAPRARVRHAQAGLYGQSTPEDARHDIRGSHAQRRAMEWYHALAWAPLLAVPLLALWAVFASLARAAFRVAANDLRLVVAELRTSIVLATRLPRLGASRSRVSKATASDAVERPLLASVGDVLRHVRSRELGAYEQWRSEQAPTDVQRVELRSLGLKRWIAFGALSALMTGVSVALYGTWLAPLFRGDMLVGSAMGSTDVSTAELWQRTWTGWSEIGLGGASLDGSFAALMLPLSVVPGGLPMGIGLLLTLAPLLAAWTAWAAAGVATRSIAARLLVAVTWGMWPPLLASVPDGRIGAVIAHVMLPVFAYALVRALGRARREVLGDGREYPEKSIGSPSAAAVAGLSMIVITVAQPILLAPLVLIVVAAALMTRGYRRFAIMVTLPALVVHGAALWTVWQSRQSERWWALLVREPGPALSSEPASPTELALGIGEQPPDWPGATSVGATIFTYGVGALVLALALIAVLSGRAQRATVVCWLIAAMGLAAALVSQAAVVSFPDGASFDGANGWPAAGLSLMGLGLLGATLAGLGRWSAPGSVLRGIAIVAIAAALSVHVVATIWPGRDFGGDVAPSGTAVLPLVAELERSEPPQTRVLILTGDADLVRYSLTSADGSSAVLGRSYHQNDPIDVLSETVAEMVGGGNRATDALRDWGIGLIVVPAGSDEIVSALQRRDDLTVAGASDQGRVWRIQAEPSGYFADQDLRVGRAWIELGTGDRLALASTPTSVEAVLDDGGVGRLVVVAVRPDDGWSASMDGRPLERVEHDGLLAYEVGATGGELRISFNDREYRWWWWAAIAAITWSVFSAIPLHDRRYGKDRL